MVGGRAALEVLATGEQTITVDNSILYSKNGVLAVDGAKSDGAKCNLTLTKCAVLAGDALTLRG